MSSTDALADPAPLGLTGFGLTTFFIGMIEANWLTASGATETVIPLAIAYGGLMQIVAGVLSFRKGDTLGTVAFNTYGAYWWWFALTELLSTTGTIASSTTTMGLVNLGFGIITAYLFVGSLTESAGLSAVFATLTLTFVILGVGDWLGIAAVVVLGGYVAMLCSLLAVYVAFGHVTNAMFGRTVIPLGSAPADRGRSGAFESGD